VGGSPDVRIRLYPRAAARPSGFLPVADAVRSEAIRADLAPVFLERTHESRRLKALPLLPPLPPVGGAAVAGRLFSRKEHRPGASPPSGRSAVGAVAPDRTYNRPMGDTSTARKRRQAAFALISPTAATAAAGPATAADAEAPETGRDALHGHG
jgi:hypothetical protein